MTNPAKGPRRVVVAPGPDGPHVADETLAASIETEAVTISDIWLTQGGEKTADYAPGADPWSLVPPEHGTTWRLVEFKAGHAPPDITTGMHETPTVDMGVILSGHISLVLEDASAVELAAGDLFVLRGAQHTWVNSGSESCVMCISLVRSRLFAELYRTSSCFTWWRSLTCAGRATAGGHVSPLPAVKSWNIASLWAAAIRRPWPFFRANTLLRMGGKPVPGLLPKLRHYWASAAAGLWAYILLSQG